MRGLRAWRVKYIKAARCSERNKNVPGGTGENKTDVVSVEYATNSRTLAEQKLRKFSEVNPDNYSMVYSVPLDRDLTQPGHYPSIEIAKSHLP